MVKKFSVKRLDTIRLYYRRGNYLFTLFNPFTYSKIISYVVFNIRNRILVHEELKI